MNKDEIFNLLKPIIVDRLGVEETEVTLQADLRNDLYADSLDAVELIMEIEKELNIAISDNDMEKFSNVQSIVDYVFEHQSPPTAAAAIASSASSQ